MDYELTDDYIAEARKRAYRFQGQWCGTSGALAADCARLIIDRERIMQTISELESRNAALRAAVESRLAGGCCDGGKCHTPPIDEKGPLADVDEHIAEDDACTPDADMAVPVDWILQGERQLKEDRANDDIRWSGDSILASPPDGLRPGSREFLAILEELKTLHLAKTLDYGVDEDALSNIRSSADVVNMPAWAGCILRISDKMHRLKAYFRRGRVEFDGVEDTLKDIACYCAIALVLYRESTTPKSPA